MHIYTRTSTWRMEYAWLLCSPHASYSSSLMPDPPVPAHTRKTLEGMIGCCMRKEEDNSLLNAYAIKGDVNGARRRWR